MVITETCPIKPEGKKPLELVDLPVPAPAPDQVLIKISTCGVCHTEIDEIEGRLIPPEFPIVPGHEIIGRVHAVGSNAKHYKPGDRVGVAWIHSSCGRCPFCKRGHENLCDDFRATGLHAHGGYAEYTFVSEAFAYSIPELDYANELWHEREIKSVANVARQDALEFLPLAAQIGIKPEVQEFPLEQANAALLLLKQGRMNGAGVLRIA